MLFKIQVSVYFYLRMCAAEFIAVKYIYFSCAFFVAVLFWRVITMKYSVLALFVSAVLLPLTASARSYTFNAALIDGGKGNVDVSLFNEGLQ
ncbi:hypothetical protein S726_005156, partial [Salmonella enterica subsp. enterica]|nr:hypothetical protein [Salmonella enterica subsp. enterica]